MRSPCPAPRFGRRSACALPLLLAAAGPAAVAPAAAQSSPYTIAGSLALTHDSNVLRLAGDQVPGLDESRSDVIASTALVGGLNQSFGRQRVYGSLTLRDNRFRHNDKYDNQSYNGSLGLDWATVERISGTLALSAARALSTFNAEGVGLLSQKNLETTEAANAAVRVGLVTAYSLELGFGQRRVRNSLDDARVLARNFDQDNVSLGLAWRPGGALTLSAALRELKGEYPNFRRDASGAFESDRFKQQQLELVSTWQPSGASGLDLRLNFGDTRYIDNEQRNFSSVNGSLGWLWQATGKLRLNTRYTRDQGQDGYPDRAFLFAGGFPVGVLPVTNNDNRTVSTYRFQADLDISAKLALSAGVQHVARTLSRTTTVPAGADPLPPQDGRDRTDLITLGVRWAPWRTTLFGCDANTERRRASGELTSSLKGAVLTCYGQLTLQ